MRLAVLKTLFPLPLSLKGPVINQQLPESALNASHGWEGISTSDVSQHCAFC